MFVNEPQNRHTIDVARGAAISALSEAPEQITEFVLRWQGRQIPFLGQRAARRDPGTGRSVVDWRLFAIGRPHTYSKLPAYSFASDAERAEAVALLREAIATFIYAYGQGPNDLGNLDINPTGG